MVRKPDLTVVTQPQEYFQKLVIDAMDKNRVSAKPETEVYLINLLNQFMTTDRLYIKDANGNYRQESLAILIKEALEEPQEEAKQLMFRYVGDVSLYVAGFFHESLSKKLVDLGYYIDMGGNAYRWVAACSGELIMKEMYKELSEKFPNFVDVLALVSDKTSPRTEKDLLRLYDFWMRTGSERAAKALQEEGIIPTKNIKKEVQ